VIKNHDDDRRGEDQQAYGYDDLLCGRRFGCWAGSQATLESRAVGEVQRSGMNALTVEIKSRRCSAHLRFIERHDFNLAVGQKPPESLDGCHAALHAQHQRCL